jgi:AcrR family transcriptional regulator
MPRAGLTPEVIVSEAALLVDEVGRDRLTLAELAKRFGVAQPSLYKHVNGLDHVHGMLAVKVLRAVGDALRRASTGKAGSDALGAVATAYRGYALAHPGCYAYILRAPAPDEDDLAAAGTEILSVLTDVFAGYGITGNAAIDAARFVRSTLHGFVSLELGGGFGMPRSVEHSYQRLIGATDQALAAW